MAKWLLIAQVILWVLFVASLCVSHLSRATLPVFLFAILRIVLITVLGLISMILLSISLFNAGGWSRLSLVSVLLGLMPLIAIAVTVGKGGFSKPLIHDITTDTSEPPAFDQAYELRNNGENSLDYAGESVAQQQQQAYPDIEPLYLPLDSEQAYRLCLQAAENLEWQVTANEISTGVIEAYDKSALFGFVDDIVIRLRESDRGIRIDVRSASRIGRGDFGANAERIHRFLAEVQRLHSTL